MAEPLSNLGRSARLAGGAADELIAAGHQAEIADGIRLATALSLSDIAHAVVLVERGALSKERGARLLSGLLELHEIPPADFPWDPTRGDAFNSREHELRRRIGADASGWLTAGRPRREAFRVALRLVARDDVLDLHDAVLDLAAALDDRASGELTTLAADYTYLQPAQPTTFGHLLVGYAEVVRRDAIRLRAVVDWLDRSVAGVGGSAGSRWPTDRERLAELLGFAGPVPHTKDAMWAADGYVELASAVAILLMNVSQIAQDFEILASREFGAIELADAHSRQSDLMPQKKNPYALPVLRAAAAEAAGLVTTLLTALHTGSGRTDHYQVLNGGIPRAIEGALAAVRLTTAVVSGMTIHRDALERSAREAFLVAADVADVVALTSGIDYRSAHTVVGRAVRRLADEGRGPDAITADLLNAVAEETLGTAIAIDEDALASALDPAACLHERTQTGSSTPTEMRILIDRGRDERNVARDWSQAVRTRADQAAEDLLSEARRLAAATPGESSTGS